MGFGHFTVAVPGYLNLAGESQVCAVEVRELGGNALDALDRVDHPVRGQVTLAGERHDVPVHAVVIGVASDRRDGLAGDPVGVDALPFEADFAWAHRAGTKGLACGGHGRPDRSHGMRRKPPRSGPDLRVLP